MTKVRIQAQKISAHVHHQHIWLLTRKIHDVK